MSCLVFLSNPGFADDTCVFSTTADDVKPNIVILLDNGAEMEHATWHSSYDNSVDYTPAVAVGDRLDVVGNARVSGTLELDNIVGTFADNDALTGSEGGSATQNGALPGSSLSYDGQTTGYFVEGETVTSASGGTATIVSVSENCNGFFDENGYTVEKAATSKYYIRPILSTTLAPDPEDSHGLFCTSTTFKINGRAVTLPYLPSTEVDGDGVKDNASRFRYSQNYLNWIFFDAAGTLELNPVSGTFTDNEMLEVGGVGYATVDGTLNYFLHYDAETSDFTVGELVTGGTSGATGTILTIVTTDATSGKLELGIVTEGAGGAFQDNEALTGDNEGVATVNGTLNGALRYDAKTSSFAVDEVVSGASGSGTIVAISTTYTGDGSDLSTKSRFYYAKKAIMTVGKLTSNNANFAVFGFTDNHNGANNDVPIGPVVSTVVEGDPASNTLDSNVVNKINNMGTTEFSPLAEGLQSVGYYYSSAAISSYVDYEYCQKHFALVVTPGVSSKDAGAGSSRVPTSLSDYDNDGAAADLIEGEIKENSTIYTIPTNVDGTTYLDDVAHYLYEDDDLVGGHRNVMTYTVGFMGNHESNLFLINTSNNGNGEKNLYDTSDLDYGKWHYEAEDPNDLASELLAAVNAILSQTSSFTAPVVPVTRTTSGNYIYMAFFTPDEGNFWEGNVTKFGIYSDGSTIMIVNKDGITPATHANGAMKETADPYWETKDWAADNRSPSPASNGIRYENRNIYTYPTTSTSTDLTHDDNKFNSTKITAAMLGNPTAVTVNGNAVSGVDKVIYYVRGADVFDEDGDGNTIGVAAGDTGENRAIITGDVLHSEPLVVYYNASTTMVYFGANDGMLHAVNDSDGTEAWAFIPPGQLSHLKNMIEGTTHQHYVDASPRVYIKDTDGDGEIEPGDPDYDKVYLVCGEREGGTSYFALDVTDPDAPVYLGAVSQSEIPELGETWSEPQFGLVKTSDEVGDEGTPVFFVGGGYSADNSLGCAVAVVDVEDPNNENGSPIGGTLVFKNDHTPSHADYSSDTIANMGYSIPSSVTVLDMDCDGFVDKLYVGDLGGQMWRFGRFTDEIGDPLTFPNSNENIKTWTGQRIFVAPTYTVDATEYRRKFFYPPAVTFEQGYHLVFMGTGDRESPCSDSSEDRIYCVKDTHASNPEFNETNLVDVTDPTDPLPDINGTDNGWYIKLATGEKVLGESTVFYKTLYITTFTPNAALADADPCMPGGLGTLWALNYLTGAAVLNFDADAELERTVSIGGGIPSKPVMVITETGQKLFISVGSTNPDAAVAGEGFGAGIVAVDPLAPPANFFLLWWRELIN